MALDRVILLVRRGRDILRDEGAVPFIKRAFLFLISPLFRRETYYIYGKDLNERREIDSALKIQKVTLKIISVPQQVDELAAEGFDFSPQLSINNLKERLNKGAMLFCVFVGKDLAHTSWVAVQDKANIDPIASKMHYQEQAYIGASATKPAYRGLGLYPYTLCQICKVLEEAGKQRVVISTTGDNRPSIKGITKAGFELYKRGCYSKLLLWKSWKEQPIKEVK